MYLSQRIETMNFLKFKFRILPILLCLTFYGVKSLTEEELAPILQQFKARSIKRGVSESHPLILNQKTKLIALNKPYLDPKKYHLKLRFNIFLTCMLITFALTLHCIVQKSIFLIFLPMKIYFRNLKSRIIKEN